MCGEPFTGLKFLIERTRLAGVMNYVVKQVRAEQLFAEVVY
jgi:hypothetical protein